MTTMEKRSPAKHVRESLPPITMHELIMQLYREDVPEARRRSKRIKVTKPKASKKR